MANSIVSAKDTDKLYLYSGIVASSTIKTSISTASWTTIPRGVSSDGTNTTTVGTKFHHMSGIFSTTIKTSGAVTEGGSPEDVDFDGTDTPWINQSVTDKLIRVSGVFTSTVKASLNITSLDNNPKGISFDGTDTLWAGDQNDKLFLQSGQYSSTVKSSVGVGGVDTEPKGIGYSGTDTMWVGDQANKMYLQSGAMTSTLKTSVSITSQTNDPTGIETDDFDARVGAAAGGFFARRYYDDFLSRAG